MENNNVTNQTNTQTTPVPTEQTQPVEPTSNTEAQPQEPQYEEVTPQFQEVQLEQKPQRTDSYFDGGLLELIGWRILASLITVVTIGIA